MRAGDGGGSEGRSSRSGDAHVQVKAAGKAAAGPRRSMAMTLGGWLLVCARASGESGAAKTRSNEKARGGTRVGPGEARRRWRRRVGSVGEALGRQMCVQRAACPRSLRAGLVDGDHLGWDYSGGARAQPDVNKHHAYRRHHAAGPTVFSRRLDAASLYIVVIGPLDRRLLFFFFTCYPSRPEYHAPCGCSKVTAVAPAPTPAYQHRHERPRAHRATMAEQSLCQERVLALARRRACTARPQAQVCSRLVAAGGPAVPRHGTRPQPVPQPAEQSAAGA